MCTTKRSYVIVAIVFIVIFFECTFKFTVAQETGNVFSSTTTLSSISDNKIDDIKQPELNNTDLEHVILAEQSKDNKLTTNEPIDNQKNNNGANGFTTSNVPQFHTAHSSTDAKQYVTNNNIVQGSSGASTENSSSGFSSSIVKITEGNNEQSQVNVLTMSTEKYPATTSIEELGTLSPPKTVKPNLITSTPGDDLLKKIDDVFEIVEKCPVLSTLNDLDNLTQDDFVTKLTDTCRYDRLVKPQTDKPIVVYMQIDMSHIESADHLQLKAHITVQLIYKDIRLKYDNLSPKRGNIVGEEALKNKIWVPHLAVENERQSSLMGLSNKDVFVQIMPTGDVIYSYRMTTTFYCWMNLKKFPFDHQICSIKWISWAYNITNIELQWEPNRPFKVAQNLHLTEFVLEEKWNDSTVHPPSFETGGLSGNYSTLIFYFRLRREVGYYIMDYFLPSILLVCMSWVTFWLQADASPPRVTLGASTMLSFITLNGGLTKNLPKVSYIKASEVWFIGCTSFIFFSLAEFAFVNVIWRRRKKVELKKQNSKHILKGALTPSLARKQLRKAESCNTLYKARSCSSLDKEENIKNNIQTNYLTVHSFPSTLTIPKITTQDDIHDGRFTSINIPEDATNFEPSMTSHPQQNWTTMTPQEIAIWIDRKSRIVFPCAFLVFNIIYWSFVYAL